MICYRPCLCLTPHIINRPPSKHIRSSIGNATNREGNPVVLPRSWHTASHATRRKHYVIVSVDLFDLVYIMIISFHGNAFCITGTFVKGIKPISQMSETVKQNANHRMTCFHPVSASHKELWALWSSINNIRSMLYFAAGGFSPELLYHHCTTGQLIDTSPRGDRYRTPTSTISHM